MFKLYCAGKIKAFKKGRGSIVKLIQTLIVVLALSILTDAYGGDRKPIKPSPKDKCPVCGMFVAKYPDFLAQILFKDGSYAFFDGTKDMFKYYLNLKKYHPTKTPPEIDSIYVMDYYSLTPIDGFKAYYVGGSNIYGPMGKELIPFQKEDEAKEFMADHVGKSLLRLQDITHGIIKGLD